MKTTTPHPSAHDLINLQKRINLIRARHTEGHHDDDHLTPIAALVALIMLIALMLMIASSIGMAYTLIDTMILGTSDAAEVVMERALFWLYPGMASLIMMAMLKKYSHRIESVKRRQLEEMRVLAARDELEPLCAQRTKILEDRPSLVMPLLDWMSQDLSTQGKRAWSADSSHHEEELTNNDRELLDEMHALAALAPSMSFKEES